MVVEIKTEGMNIKAIMFVIMGINLSLSNVKNTWMNELQGKESKFLNYVYLKFSCI